MEHRGVEYRIIQGIQRGLWKWSVETETGTKSGTSDSKDAAMTAAKRAIDKRARSQKTKALNPLFAAWSFVVAFQRRKPTAIGVKAPYLGFIEPELGG